MYAPEGSTDLDIKKPHPSTLPFGLPSISVSWKALSALSAATGLRPKAADSVLSALVQYRSSNMAYGSRSAVFGAPLSINESPRHTGMAVLLRLLFSKDVNSVSLLQDLFPTIRWLIDVHLDGGGWSFEQKLREQGLGPITTAAALAGLCVFAKRMHGSQLLWDELKANLNHTVRTAFAALLKARVGTLWLNSNEGGAEVNQVADSSLIISLLSLSTDLGALEDIENGSARRVHQLKRDLISISLQDGWPGHIGGRTSVISASVCALQALSNMNVQQLTTSELARVRSAHNRVLSDFAKLDTWQNLRLWDWACLTELAVARVGSLKQSESAKLERVVVEIRTARANEAMSSHLLKRVSGNAGRAVLYSLTRGGTQAIPARRFELWWEKRGPFFRYFAVPFFWLSIGILLKILVDRYLTISK